MGCEKLSVEFRLVNASGVISIPVADIKGIRAQEPAKDGFDQCVVEVDIETYEGLSGFYVEGNLLAVSEKYVQAGLRAVAHRRSQDG